MRSLSASQYDFSTPYDFAPRPDWVEPRTAPEKFACGEGIPLSYSLVDVQLLSTDDMHTFFRRLAMHIADASCIEDASQFLYDTVPGSEMVIFHSCKIIRGDQEIDALDRDNIRSMQRETQLESHVSTNRITIELIIDDLRVGDVIDIEVSALEIKGEHPLYGRFLRWMSRTSWSAPVALQSLRVTNNSSTPLSVQQIDSANDLDERKSVAPDTTFEMQWKDIPIGQSGSQQPDNYWPACVFVTSAAQWTDVSKYLYNYYQNNGAFDRTIEIDKEEALDFTSGTAESITNIIRFVQDNIRYRSDSTGIFSHTPKSPSRTLKKRTGDCKDKSNLLVSLLQKAGIEAELALVNTNLNDAISDLDPSPFLFNHMIVCFKWQGKNIFVDATCQKQGGTLEELVAPECECALILSAEGSGLAPIHKTSNALELQVIDNFDFSNIKKSSASVEIIREYYGRRANNMRFYFASQNTEALQKSYHESTAEQLEVKLALVSPMTIDSDDRQNNILKTSERYEFQPDDEGLNNGRIVIHTGFLSDLSISTTAQHPVDLSLSGRAKHTINILYAKKPDFIEADSFSKENKWFNYKDTTAQEGNQTIFTMDLEPLNNIVAADELDEYRKQADAVYERANTVFPVVLQDNTAIAKTMFIIAVILGIAVVAVNSLL